MAASTIRSTSTRQQKDTKNEQFRRSNLFNPHGGRSRHQGSAAIGLRYEKLSIVGRDYHTDEHVVGYYNANDRMKAWGRNGAFWGGIWGLLFGSAFFAIPGLGPLLVAGPLVAWIVGALEGAVVVGGLSVIGPDAEPRNPQGQHPSLRDRAQESACRVNMSRKSPRASSFSRLRKGIEQGCGVQRRGGGGGGGGGQVDRSAR